jgi:hypothetical protein
MMYFCHAPVVCAYYLRLSGGTSPQRAHTTASGPRRLVRLAALCLGVLQVVGTLDCTRNACDLSSSSAPQAPPIITIVNAATGQSICDANVVATCLYRDAGIPLATVVLPDASAAGCPYGVARYWADGGLSRTEPLMEVYCTLHVAELGFASAVVPNVSLQGDGCTPGTSQVVTIQLQPN